MGTHITKETFEFLYNSTYSSILKYTIYHCRNLDDVNDIIQDIYTELYQTIMNKKYIDLENVESYIIGIAKNKIKGHYNLIKNKYQVQAENENLYQICCGDYGIFKVEKSNNQEKYINVVTNKEWKYNDI